MGSAGSEVAAAFDALDAAVEAILELDYDGVDPAARVGLDARLQRNLRRLPAAENQIIASLLEQTEPSRLGEASWPKVFSTMTYGTVYSALGWTITPTSAGTTFMYDSTGHGMTVSVGGFSTF